MSDPSTDNRTDNRTANQTDVPEAVRTYFAAWRAVDFARLRPFLAEDVHFTGPLAEVRGADEYVSSMAGLGSITTDIVIRHTFVDGDDDGGDVLTWFDLHTSVASPMPVANWTHLENGLITRVRVTFDPREMV